MSKWQKEPDPTATIVCGRPIFRMSKPRAKTYLVFTEDSDESWFIYEYTCETKTNIVKNRSIFIAKDVPQIIEYRKTKGWVLEKLDEPLEETARI